MPTNKPDHVSTNKLAVWALCVSMCEQFHTELQAHLGRLLPHIVQFLVVHQGHHALALERGVEVGLRRNRQERSTVPEALLSTSN